MRRRSLVTRGVAFAAVLGGALLIAWLSRFSVANRLVERKLAALDVPASYRITKIGPFLQRLEDVRIGDASAPDLVARRIDVTIGYGLAGPTVRHVAVDGVRLRGRYDGTRFRFGAVDRLLPQSGGAAGLPDLSLSIRDTRVTVATPAGVISATLAGEGNPARRFDGNGNLVALSLQAGGCTVNDVAAVLKIASKDGNPEASGPVRMSRLTCPQHGVALGQGAVQIRLASDRSFARSTLEANLAGAAGRVSGISFSSFDGRLSGSRSSSGWAAAAKLDVRSATAPDYARALGRSATLAAGTPLAPVVERAIGGGVALLRRADASARLSVEQDSGRPPVVRLHQLLLTGKDGARLILSERAGLSWTHAGLRTDGDLSLSGGALPTATIQLRQAGAGAVLTGTATMRLYRTGAAQLGLTPLSFRWDGERADWRTTVTIDGPLGDGFVRGLTVPLAGFATRTGTVRMGAGCQPVAFGALRVASFGFGPARITLCGQPIVARDPGGTLRIDATTGPVRLNGTASGGAPATLSASGIRFTQAGFALQNVAVTLGGGERPTYLNVASLDGGLGDPLQGRFADATGGIANVPLVIGGASGNWTLSQGALRLSGTLNVSDADKTARFNPLATDDAKLSLIDGLIVASATLRQPAGGAEVARVDLNHDLTRGTGHARLDVPGITFQPGKLQPEAITPLTLGVVANVVGTIKGAGRIDWGPRGVTSSGEFGTERLDLAAAFGPVTAIKGRLRFTDLLGLVTAPDQEASVGEINPGVPVTNGVVHYQLIGNNKVRIEEASWPFARGELRLEPTTLDFGSEAERHMNFRLTGLDAAAFVQQLDFPNISATGTFDGILPMVFDKSGGRIEGGSIVAREGGGTLAYVGELSTAQLGTMGKLAFDALKAIRYSSLDISLDGRLDGEMVSRVRFTGIREATPVQSLVTRLIRNLPFRFNITVRAPFRGLVGSARAYIDPRLLLTQGIRPTAPAASPPPVQAPASGRMP